MAEAPRPRGRQTVYTPEAAEEILERISAGESLRSICEDDHMPSEAAVRWWVVDDREGFAAQYASARMAQAVGWADELTEISDDIRVEHQRSRLMVDTRKWLLSKVIPKVFGDKLDVKTDGNGVINVTIRKFEGDE